MMDKRKKICSEGDGEIKWFAKTPRYILGQVLCWPWSLRVLTLCSWDYLKASSNKLGGESSLLWDQKQCAFSNFRQVCSAGYVILFSIHQQSWVMDLPMGSPAKTLTMKTSITPGNFIRRTISLMLNKLPDCDVPAEDDIWVNTLFIQVQGRKQETLRLCSGSPPKPTSLLHQLCADGRRLGAGARSACGGTLWDRGASSPARPI